MVYSHKRQHILCSFTIQLSLLFYSLNITASENGIPWAVTYADNNGLNKFSPYQIIILDSHSHQPINKLLANNKTLLGYISLGEVASYRSYFKSVDLEGLLLHENVNWKGSYAIDISDPRWLKRVTNELIPEILDQGFQGIFIDTLDIPLHLAQTQAFKYGNLKRAAVNMVKSIREHFPDIIIMVNRAYPILSDIGGVINFVLGESVLTTYNFKEKRYEYMSNEDYQYSINILKSLKSEFPQVNIMTLDYWNPDDSGVITKIYEKQRTNGFSPYVSTIELNQIIPEPGS